MNQKEVVDTLSIEAKIEPSFTELGNITLSKSISSLLATWGSRISKQYHSSYVVGLMAVNHGIVFCAQAQHK
jgi:hypothetical protein